MISYGCCIQSGYCYFFTMSTEFINSNNTNDFQEYLDKNLQEVHLDNLITDIHSLDSYDVFEEIRLKISFFRHKKHLTQKDLARKSGITQANISNIEKGISKPTIETLQKIANAFEMRLFVDFIESEVE